MKTRMQIPVYLNTVSRLYGPVYADNNYKVVFDNLYDNANYKLGMKGGLIKCKSVIESAGTQEGKKLTFTVNTTYIRSTDGVTVNVTTGANGTEFYLTMIM